MNWDQYLSEERYQLNSGIDDPADRRTPFEVDCGRVLFSSAIRRMHDKTQVIPLTNGDSVLTRLTHSIHVMNIAESLMLDYTRSKNFIDQYPVAEKRSRLSSDLVAIVKTAAFVHDVGNPPFGHFGETIIQDYFKKLKEKQNNFCASLKDGNEIERKALDYTQFDGNAQGLRVLTRLQYVGSLSGLNLTYASLAAYMKYPNPKEADKHYIGTKKHGVFWTEEGIFEEIVDKCKLRISDGKIKRHPLSFIVEAADSIAYLTMDIEDGYALKWFTFETLINGINSILNTVNKGGENNNENSKNAQHQKNIIDIIKYKSEGFNKNVLSGAYKKAATDFREAIIQYLVNLAVSNFINNIDAIDSGEYSKELIEDDENRVAEALAQFSKKYIITRREICSEEITGRNVIIGLLNQLSFYAFSQDRVYRDKFKSLISRSRLELAIHENFKHDKKCCFFDISDLYGFDIGEMGYYERWRIIVDFVSSMTDKYAVNLYQKLSGNRL